MRTIENLPILAAAFFISTASAQDYNLPILEHVYDNGLRLLVIERLRYGNHERSASYVQRVRAVSEDDVVNVARKYLRPDNMQVILFGEEAFEFE